MSFTTLSENVSLFRGIINCAIIRHGESAILIDCDAELNSERLSEIGINKVEKIFLTQHRRDNSAGVKEFIAQGAELHIAEKERFLIDDVPAFWTRWGERWDNYSSHRMPLVLPESLDVSAELTDKQSLDWNGISITAYDSPGATDASMSFHIQDGEESFLFCGDVIYEGGRIYDLYCLQHAFNGAGHYHGFIGNKDLLIESLEALTALDIPSWIPSHGEIVTNPSEDAAQLIERLIRLERNVSQISSMNFYIPRLYKRYKEDTEWMPPAETFDLPSFVLRPTSISFLLVSDTGAGLLVDCGMHHPILKTQEFIKERKLEKLEAIWVTHYHDDHVQELGANGYHKITTQIVADVVRFPRRYSLPCLSPNPSRIDRIVEHGETWQWHEFTLTAYDFPGQTLYHSGLLVEGHSSKLFFAGDSGSPKGVDDHCTPNRNFNRPGTGFRRCIEIWRETQPDFIFNQHQEQGFHFDESRLDYMEKTLAERFEIYKEMMPWEDPDFGLDALWVRSYPYEQDAIAGSTQAVEIQFTNHSSETSTAEICSVVVPEGWAIDTSSAMSTEIPGETDGAITSKFIVPDSAEPGHYVVVFSIIWNGKKLGQIVHTTIWVL
ncbi:MAG: MBL fold metallo-hydrolase [Lentisphaeria bacterium]|nr:MBL fold metallo-hydrolase [Lentisphaeria bacterium]